ncbi:MAG: DUF418 domain-containing transporter [Myxococcales bacterium]|nr:DUF418 domain-containing transporter [Myxococcales bacterium]
MPAPARARLLSLDALRGLAVLLMMEQHMGVWLYDRPRSDVSTVLIAFNALGGAAAPLFVTLAGIGTALSLRGGRGDLVLVRRGLTVMAFGYLLSLLTPSWFTLRSWFVLHVMGAAILSAPLWRRFGVRGRLALAALVVAATPLIQTWLDTPASLSNDRMALKPPFDGLPGGHLRVAFAEGQFPIFPWLAMFLVGMAAGSMIAADDRRGLRRLAVAVLAIGLALAALGYADRLLPDVPLFTSLLWRRAFALPLGFFPATASVIVLLQSVVLWLLLAALAVDERAPYDRRAWIVALGRSSLTLLLVHVVVFRELTRPLGLWQALEAEEALAVIGLWLVLCGTLARAWEKVGYRYGAEWLLRKIAG